MKVRFQIFWYPMRALKRISIFRYRLEVLIVDYRLKKLVLA